MRLPSLIKWLHANDFEGWQDSIAPLERFVDDLYEQNKSFNLTAIPPEDCEEKHLIDSLLIADLIPHGASVLDIGTGAGFPAWPLALLRPDLRVIALDSTAKRLRFIERHPLPNLTTFLGRAESDSEDLVTDVVTGRAVAPLAIQMEVSAPHVNLGGLFIPFRTPSESAAFMCPETKKVGLEYTETQSKTTPSGTTRVFPIYKKVATLPRQEQRRWSEIKSKPLF